LDFRRDDVNISPAEAERHAVEPQLSSFIASIVRMLRHHLVGLAIANLASIMIAWIALTVVHTSYKSTTEILLVDPKAHIGTGEHSISAFDIDNSAINSEIELLRSRSIADVVVRQLGLARDPEFVDSGLITAKPDHEATAVDLAAGALVKRIDVQRVPFSYALTLTVTSADPAKAQRIARAVAETFLLDQQSTRQEALQRLAEWSTQRVEQLREQVAEADSAVEKVKSELGLSDGTNPTLQKLTAINADPRTYVKLKELEPLAESQHKLYEAALVQLSEVNGSERYQATTARVITPASLPEGPGAKRKLIYPAAVIFITLSFLFIVWLIEKLKGAFWTPLAVEHATGHPVLGLIPIINGAESGPPYGGRAAKRRYCAAVGSWIRCWLPRAKSLFPSTSLSDPGWQLRMLSAAAKNLGRSLRAALAIRARGQMVPSMTLDSLLDMMLEEPHGGLRDAVRAGRAMSRLTDGGATKSVVSVVSAVPGEGKSATALLLATSSSLSGVRTVLLDCDPRCAALSRMVQTSSANRHFDAHEELNRNWTAKDTRSGLTIVSIDQSDLDNGKNGAALADLVVRLSTEYECVVIDSPPVLGATADALFVAGLAQKVLMVIAWGQTSATHVMEALRLLQFQDRPIAGILLNKVDYRQLETYGVYGYGSKYAHGRTEIV
jgi:succinoglycan biosynthesis transport protein ExoP